MTDKKAVLLVTSVRLRAAVAAAFDMEGSLLSVLVVSLVASELSTDMEVASIPEQTRGWNTSERFDVKETMVECCEGDDGGAGVVGRCVVWWRGLATLGRARD